VTANPDISFFGQVLFTTATDEIAAYPIPYWLHKAGADLDTARITTICHNLPEKHKIAATMAAYLVTSNTNMGMGVKAKYLSTTEGNTYNRDIMATLTLGNNLSLSYSRFSL